MSREHHCTACDWRGERVPEDHPCPRCGRYLSLVRISTDPPAVPVRLGQPDDEVIL